MDPGLKMYFIKNGDIPASYVSFPEGTLPETNSKSTFFFLKLNAWLQ